MPPSGPCHLDTPVSFVSWRLCIWHAGHGRGEANKPSIDSKCGATGDSYSTHSRPCCRAVSTVDSWKWRNSFPGIEKKDQDSRVSLTSLYKTKTINAVYCVIKKHSKIANTLCNYRNVTLRLKPYIRHMT